jgi:hypothetical protein
VVDASYVSLHIGDHYVDLLELLQGLLVLAYDDGLMNKPL